MRTAIITGAMGDIGAATADAFAGAGHRLALLDRTAAALPTGAEGLALACDPADPEAVAAAFAAIAARFGVAAVLVNAAGTDHRAPVTAMRIADWDRVMDETVGAMFLTAKHAIPLMAGTDDPAIVNLASVAGHLASADGAALAASMAAVESFTWALAGEVGPRGIRVNAVVAGPAAPGGGTAPLLGRMAGPDEVARAILWLASRRASFITGTTLVVDGGLTRGH